MAVKTITIDMEAYEALSRLKRGGQSFSDVIKANFGRRRRASDLLAALPTLDWSEQLAGSVARQAKLRGKQRARAARL